MAVFAIGDVQGCMQALQRLLERIRFDPTEDLLWFAGDLINRGPHSLEVLRFVRGLGDHAVAVLGNHDLHLIAMAAGIRAPSHSLATILKAEDGPELIAWLRHRPLLWHDTDLGYVMVHAGLAPAWDLDQASRLAHEAETALGAEDSHSLLEGMYGDRPERWSDDLRGMERLRAIINIFTRLRYVTRDGALDFKHSGTPGTQPPHLIPWFLAPGRRNADAHIVFGHWATLGPIKVPNLYPLDTGCVWGGNLSALRLDGEQAWFSVPCEQGDKPWRG